MVLSEIKYNPYKYFKIILGQCNRFVLQEQLFLTQVKIFCGNQNILILNEI